MKELKCPQCGSVFTVDEADYASIVSQVKTQEFDAEVKSRLEEIQKQNEVRQEAESLKISQEYQGKLNAKELEITKKDNEIRVKDLIDKGRGAGGVVGVKPLKNCVCTVIKK